MAASLFIAGIGYALPERVVDNHEVATMIETSDTFIRERTGVVSRRYLAPGQSLADLACPAAERAMADAGVSAQDVDLLIVNTLSPDYHDPSQACYLQPRLGLREIPCFDIRAQCCGELYGIEIARHFVASGMYRNVLLVCAEALSRRVDTSLAGRNLSVLLGDGAAALLLRPSPDPAVGVLDLILGAAARNSTCYALRRPVRGVRISSTPLMWPTACTSSGCVVRRCSTTRRAESSTRADRCSTGTR